MQVAGGYEITLYWVGSAAILFFSRTPELKISIHCNCLWAEKGVMTMGAGGKLLTRL